MSKTRDRIRKAKDYRHKIVAIDEWDGVEIEARSVDVATRDLVGSISEEAEPAELSHMQLEVIMRSCYDPETGELVFDRETDAELLLGKSPAVIQRLWRTVTELSAITDEAHGEAEKNS